MKRILTFFAVSLASPLVVFAQGTKEEHAAETVWQKFFIAFSYNPLEVVGAAALLVGFFTVVILVWKPKDHGAGAAFFILITLPILAATYYVTADTLYQIKASPTGGPVHWHADFRIFNCGEEVDLRDPAGISNRIGTPVIHEHGDRRIHAEGTLLDLSEASLAGFFEAIGGTLNNELFIVPTNMGEERMQNGALCSDGTAGVLQAFLWGTAERRAGGPIAVQRKLADFSSYVISAQQLVPPGDCVIFEFGEEKEKTQYVCEQYEVAEVRGDLEGAWR